MEYSQTYDCIVLAETLHPEPSADRPATKLGRVSFRRWKREPRVCVSRSFVSWGELLRLCRWADTARTIYGTPREAMTGRQR